MPLRADIRHTIMICVRQFPNAGRRGDVHRPVKPKTAFREHHFVCEHNHLVEPPVPIGILQTHDSMRLFLQLLVRFFIRA